MDQCADTNSKGIYTCHLPGGFCLFDDSITRPLVTTAFAGIVTSTDVGVLPCTDATTARFCEPGQYCNNGAAKICEAGNYCPLGTAEQIECAFPLMSCPESGAEEQYSGVVFGMLLLIFTLCLWFYRAYSNYQIRRESLSKWNKMAKVVHGTKSYDTMNELALEHNQRVMVKATEDLYQSMAARERLLTSTRVNHHIDWDEVNRFSKDLRRFNTVRGGNLTFEDDIEEDEEVETTEAQKVEATENKEKSISTAGDALNAKRPAPAPLVKRLSVMRTGKVQSEGSKLVTQLQANLQDYEYDDVPTPLTVSFLNMNLTLKASGTTVLRNICVSIRPFNVTAIMGPSGAGKTTFLSLLRGQAHYAKVTGSMTVNGYPVESLERLKTRTAYVPQDDIVNDDLSVEENIVFSALLFNKRGHVRVEEVMPMVVQAERLLDIVLIRTSVVGSPLQRGISGGQKKRVSIAMELMKEAELFFLDEPTSGLDSASSMLVVNALHFLASKGVNVSTTIHQPRQEILSLMDNLLLLAPGGRVAYFGPFTDLHSHFSQLHYTCPVGINIADFVMDLLCGFVPEDGTSEMRDVHVTIKVMCDWWEENKYPAFALDLLEKNAEQKKLTTLEALVAPAQSPTEDRAWRYKNYTQTAKVFLTCFTRQMKVNQRRIDSIAVTCGLMLVFGIVVAFLSGEVSLDGTSGALSSFSAQMTSGALVFSLLVQSASLKLFTDDKLLRNREFTAGLQIGPYFLGKILGNFIEPCFYAFAFLTGNYPFIKARAPFIEYWYCFLLLHLAISGLVNFLAVAYPGSNTATISVGVVVLLWSFGGVSPNISTMEDSMSVFATILNAVSPFNYSFQVEVINEIQMYPNVWNPEKLLGRFDYRSVDRDPCIGALILYWFISNLLAYCVAEVQPHWPRIKKDIQHHIFHPTDGWLSKKDALDSASENASSSERNTVADADVSKEVTVTRKVLFGDYGAVASQDGSAASPAGESLSLPVPPPPSHVHRDTAGDIEMN
eukprot:CAMPEP_0185012042 /NCGR_PEP_ID=MMETSP1098-20130426/98099_1 /TAXON_ID=89044 /ORGANISM="Spumella elongata, Strain CCAP 955/1" /LENGTH=1003 /DNA_ID=CAMNT_0027541093 /DNA_START=23 /DNA_END=3034 /DNA_ORIENTATION=+